MIGIVTCHSLGIDLYVRKFNLFLFFSPFFSTKKDGQGIGLTLVREVLTNHGFHFTLERDATAAQTER